MIQMSIELPAQVEEQLRNLAARQKRDIGSLVGEAIRQYLEAEAITDLDAAEVAEAQLALIVSFAEFHDALRTSTTSSRFHVIA